MKKVKKKRRARLHVHLAKRASSFLCPVTVQVSLLLEKIERKRNLEIYLLPLL